MFASLSASEGNSSEGIHMGISVLLGSSLFILAIVTALVVLASPRDIKLNKHFFLRDCFFLLVAQCLLLWSMLVHEELGVLTSTIFLLLYFVYVIVVLYQDRKHEKDEREKEKTTQAISELSEI